MIPQILLFGKLKGGLYNILEREKEKVKNLHICGCYWIDQEQNEVSVVEQV